MNELKNLTFFSKNCPRSVSLDIFSVLLFHFPHWCPIIIPLWIVFGELKAKYILKSFVLFCLLILFTLFTLQNLLYSKKQRLWCSLKVDRHHSYSYQSRVALRQTQLRPRQLSLILFPWTKVAWAKRPTGNEARVRWRVYSQPRWQGPNVNSLCGPTKADVLVIFQDFSRIFAVLLH